MDEEKSRLIEEFGLMLEDSYQLSPLGARIYALLVLSGDGLTFDEIRDDLQASKSSVSTNINALLQLKFITYFTKTGDRKRYFKSSNKNLLTFLEKELKKAEKTLEIVQKVNVFKKARYPEAFKENRRLGEIYVDYLENHIMNLNTARENFRKFLGEKL